MDGEGFLLLTDEDFMEMVKAVGTRRKLIAKRNILYKEELSQVPAGSKVGNCPTRTSQIMKAKATIYS